VNAWAGILDKDEPGYLGPGPSLRSARRCTPARTAPTDTEGQACAIEVVVEAAAWMRVHLRAGLLNLQMVELGGEGHKDCGVRAGPGEG
jgi:hypothetical protein